MRKLQPCQDYLLPICRDLRKYRNIHGMSQKELAMSVGVNQSQYSKKELGKQEFTLSEIFAICIVLNLDWRIEFSPKSSKPLLSISGRIDENNDCRPFYGL